MPKMILVNIIADKNDFEKMCHVLVIWNSNTKQIPLFLLLPGDISGQTLVMCQRIWEEFDQV